MGPETTKFHLFHKPEHVTIGTKTKLPDGYATPGNCVGGTGIGHGVSSWLFDGVEIGMWLAKTLPVESKSTANVAKVSTFLVIGFENSPPQRFAQVVKKLYKFPIDPCITNKILGLVMISEFGTIFSQNGKEREELTTIASN